MIIFVFLFPMRSSKMNVPGGKALWKNRWKYIGWCFLKKTALLGFSGEEKQPFCVKNSHLVQNKHWNGALFTEAYLHTYFSFPVLCLEFSSVFFQEGNEYSFLASKPSNLCAYLAFVWLKPSRKFLESLTIPFLSAVVKWKVSSWKLRYSLIFYIFHCRNEKNLQFIYFFICKLCNLF